MIARSLRSVASWLAVLLLAACATIPVPEPGLSPAEGSASFEVSGRFSAKTGSEGAAGQFAWSHSAVSDVLTFATPIGQTLARMSGDGQDVRLEIPGRAPVSAPDWESLTVRAIGIPVPVRGLAFWLRALPRADAPHDDERDSGGRLSVLRQDGWEIVYGYAGGGHLPARLRLTYPEIDLRIAIDAWR